MKSRPSLWTPVANHIYRSQSRWDPSELISCWNSFRTKQDRQVTISIPAKGKRQKKKKKQKKKPQKPTLVFIFFNALEIVGVYLGSVTVIGSLETRDVKGFWFGSQNGLKKNQRTWGQAGHHNNKKRLYKIKSSFIKTGNPEIHCEPSWWSSSQAYSQV